MPSSHKDVRVRALSGTSAEMANSDQELMSNDDSHGNYGLLGTSFG